MSDSTRRAEATKAARAHKQDRIARGASFEHGTQNGYINYGCRCDACRLARKRARKDRKGTRRPAAEHDGFDEVVVLGSPPSLPCSHGEESCIFAAGRAKAARVRSVRGESSYS